MVYRRHDNAQICQIRGPTSQTKFTTKGICKVIKYLGQNFLFYKIKSKIPWQGIWNSSCSVLNLLFGLHLNQKKTSLLFYLNKRSFRVSVLWKLLIWLMTSKCITELFSLPLFFQPSILSSNPTESNFKVFSLLSCSHCCYFELGNHFCVRQFWLKETDTFRLSPKKKNGGYFLEHICRVQMKLKSYQDPKDH